MDCCSAQKERITQYDDAIAHTHTHPHRYIHILTHTCPHIKQLNGIAFHRKVKQNQKGGNSWMCVWEGEGIKNKNR